MKEDSNRWGLDLGGTKIEGAVLTSDGECVFRDRIPTGGERGYDNVLANIGGLVRLMSQRTGLTPSRVGLGTPGTLDRSTGLMKNSNLLCLNDRPLLDDLNRGGGVEFRIANDANCFTLAEYTMGSVRRSHRSSHVVFGVIMGSGVGGGILVDGQILGGRHGIGGEWGHMRLDPALGDCYCGGQGCVELALSGLHTERRFEEACGRSRGLAQICEDFLSGSDQVARDLMTKWLEWFGLALSNVVNLLDPDVIVLGGGVSNLKILYDRGVEEVKKHVFGRSFTTPIVKAELGDSAGVLGAAFL